MGDHLKLPSCDGALMLLGESGGYETGVPVVCGAEEWRATASLGLPLFK